MTPRLLALDMDGTLISHDGDVAREDVIALERCRDEGLAVTLCTGRIVSGTLPVARALDLKTPIICADGAIVADPLHGQVQMRFDLDAEALTALTLKLQSGGVVPFWCTHDEIHGEHAGEDYAGFVRVWSPQLTLHPSIQHSPVWARPHEVTMMFGIGDRDVIEAAHAWVQAHRAESVYSVCFQVMRSSAWTLLARRRGVDKSVGLSWVAERLGLHPGEVAVVGDWINDVPMFRWAGRSFAMGNAPIEVSREATDTLTATHHTGGGVAEAVRRLLSRDRH